MAFTTWRGAFGFIKPTLRPGSLEELIRMLPEGIGVMATHINIRKGTTEEFSQVLPEYEARVKDLAEAGADLIHPAGAPPFFLLGYEGEAKLIREWEQKYGVPIFTNGTSQINALRAFGAKRFVGVSYFRGGINRSFARYFEGAGFEVLAMEGMDIDFDKVQTLASTEVYAFIKKLWLAHPEAEAIYMLGSGWRTLDIIELMERDFGIPVVHHVPAQSWEIQKRLHVRQPVRGYGRLVLEMP